MVRPFVPLNFGIVRLFHRSVPRPSVSPLQRYDSLVRSGRLQNDDFQRKTIADLNHLHDQLVVYTPPPLSKPEIEDLEPKGGVSGMLSSLFSKKPSDPLKEGSCAPKGLYLYGDVGCGKTMLMDLFFDTVPLHLHKKRIHFHQFMQNLHKRSHQLKMQYSDREFDVIPILAWELAESSKVLCFDEFQVTDVVDAMLLRRLLMLLLNKDHGVVLFATSNRAPSELYINGVQRESFVPCIKLIEKVTTQIFLNSATDYRKIPKPRSSVYYFPPPGVSYHSPSSLKAQQAHIENWYSYFSQGREPRHDMQVAIWGRKLLVPKSSAPYVAQFTFKELCGQPLAAGDYLALASTFQSFILTDIPYLSINSRDEVRRFITFLDAVYDARGRVAVTAAASFNDLFVEPEDVNEGSFELNSRSKDEDVREVELVEKHHFDKKVARSASMFAIDEERFAFARALSRLSQMSTQEWVDRT